MQESRFLTEYTQYVSATTRECSFAYFHAGFPFSWEWILNHLNMLEVTLTIHPAQAGIQIKCDLVSVSRRITCFALGLGK
jgi:hypothetical protein